MSCALHIARRCQITKMSFCAILWTLEIALIEPHSMPDNNNNSKRWRRGRVGAAAIRRVVALQWPHIKQTGHVPSSAGRLPLGRAHRTSKSTRNCSCSWQCASLHLHASRRYGSMCKLSMRMRLGIADRAQWFYVACARLQLHFTAALLISECVCVCVWSKSESKFSQEVRMREEAVWRAKQ